MGVEIRRRKRWEELKQANQIVGGRCQGRGFVHGGFVTHCRSSSLAEAMMTECQLVLLPNDGDQIINARLTGEDLKIGVEVEKGPLVMTAMDLTEPAIEAILSVLKPHFILAVKTAMDENGEVGKQVKDNHDIQREILLMKQGLESSYIYGFVHNLHDLLKL
ncbi:hypothetical protein EZV62_026785 [Acer yangbiense]|uniref:Uncharacterized protein n=1 Tax=Acer yangbiense TaxID=1000413 RepID=A0A5C7GRV1_9ROSI|nr:hypothetical protein EZV62_026785 [Acer yangbiense]